VAPIKRRGASAEGADGVEFLGRGVSLPSRLRGLGERRELPQRRQRILGIFQCLRSLLETMHYTESTAL